jgi:hypothetical protein
LMVDHFKTLAKIIARDKKGDRKRRRARSLGSP